MREGFAHIKERRVKPRINGEVEIFPGMIDEHFARFVSLRVIDDDVDFPVSFHRFGDDVLMAASSAPSAVTVRTLVP